jgi:D-3-phosphoglycerate dehydrogenase
MYEIALFATPSSMVDEKTLRTAVEEPVRFTMAPERSLRYGRLEPDELTELCAAAAHADAIVFRAGQVPCEVIKAAPNLKIVAVHGVGTSAVAMSAATERGVYVTVAPGTNATSVAEYVMSVSLLARRRLDQAAAKLQSATWQEARAEGFELFGKRTGIVGFGAIGSRVAALAHAFGMEVLVAAYPSLRDCPYSALSLAELAPSVDYLVIALPFRPTTKGLISAEILGLMRPTAVVVNISRGEIIDEAALVEALDERRLAAACLDVFAQEPVPPGHPLPRHPRIFATPHIAGATHEALTRIARTLGEDIRRVFHGERPLHAANAPAEHP